MSEPRIMKSESTVDLGQYLNPVKLQLAEPLVKLEKLRLRDGRIHYFLYQQDGSKQQMSCRDTPDNRLLVAWIQIHDSPTTGHEWERTHGPVT